MNKFMIFVADLIKSSMSEQEGREEGLRFWKLDWAISGEGECATARCLQALFMFIEMYEFNMELL